jgi:hypothetical protein
VYSGNPPLALLLLLDINPLLAAAAAAQYQSDPLCAAERSMSI